MKWNWRELRDGFRLRSLFAALALVVGGVPAAFAQQPTAQSYGPGLPMWVVRDDDSTIYITGTVHMLRDDHRWRSPKLDAAFAEATELWLELEEIGSEDALQSRFGPLMEKYATYDGPPVSSLLNAYERELLTAALAEAGAPPDAAEKLDKLQPWMTIQTLGRDYATGGIYKSENGIDIAFARMAIARDMPIRGMETLETQVALITGLSVEAQLAQLRAILRAPPGAWKQEQRVADLAFGSWTRGETNLTEALMTFTRLAMGALSDPLLKDRNEAWAGVIEEMLKGSGVSFIAVGAGHLVGPDSLQDRLKLRGIGSERY